MTERPQKVSVDLMLLLEVLQTLRLAHVWALKDSHPQELGPAFKPWKWDGHEQKYVDEAHEQYRRLFAEIRPQVPDRPSGEKLVHVSFEWSDRFGECYECGLPAAYESSEHDAQPESLRCSVCAAQDAARGASIRWLGENTLFTGHSRGRIGD